MKAKKMMSKGSHMGGQGMAAKIPVNHFKNKPVKHTMHPAGMKSKHAVSKPFNATSS